MPRPPRPPTPPRPPDGPVIDLPGDDPTLPPWAAFAALDEGLPLALLPLRLETRWYLDQDPPELRVRIFPDVIHGDGHSEALSAAEQEMGRAYWGRVWRAGTDDGAAADAAFGWLAGNLGAWRAAWVVRRMTPTNLGKAPAAAVPPGQAPAPPPRFPAVETLAHADAVRARLLPTRLAVVGYYAGEVVGTWWGAAIPEGLAMAPRPAEASGEIDGRSWLEAQGLAWTLDFAEAEKVGMGVRIDLSRVDAPVAAEGFGTLLAVGVRAGDQREALEALLAAHRYTRGLDLIPQGAATNAGAAAAPAPAPGSPDLAAVRASTVFAAGAAARPAVAEEGDLLRMAGADAAAVALGLGRDTALDRAANAGLRDLERAEWMNLALWPAVGGHYLDALMAGSLTPGGRAWLRDWSTRFVRGGAPLPTLLVGSQPYGILPAGLVSPPDDGPRTNVQQVGDVLELLRGFWQRSLAAVPRLDPDASDVPPLPESDGEMAAVVSQVLGAVPHPSAFRLRQVDAMRDTYETQYGGHLFFIAWFCSTLPDPDTGTGMGPVDDNPAWARYDRLQDDLAAAGGIDEQLDALRSFADEIVLTVGSDSDQFYHLVPDVPDMASWLVELVEAHADRTEPVAFLSDLRPAITRMIGDEDDPHAFFDNHAESHRDWAQPLVAPGAGGDDAAAVRDWLALLAGRVDAEAGTPHEHGTPFPLLRELLRWGIDQAGDPGDRAALAAGIGDEATGLVAIAAGGADPVGELERLMREALGPWSYRLDAWYTAIAAWRLENKRAARPRGIQVGAFGWLTDPRPREADASQGYVFAPSLAHATTAAILRSGWAAFGGAGAGGDLAVDLRSDRVRRARWIVEGVRQGQDLGRLLGARLERGLHDAGLDRWIDDLRQAALTAVGSPAPPTAIVDGLLLARARSGADDLTDDETAAAAGIEAVLARSGGARKGLEDVLATLASDLDAVADAALAQGVFALAQGNAAEAAATLAASTSGEVTFPPLRVADTPRGAVSVTHRLLLLVAPGARGAWPAAARSGRAVASPAVEAWVEELLGPPGDVPLSVAFRETGTGAELAPPAPFTLADAGLSALDLVYLGPAGDDPGLGRLGEVLAAWARTRRPKGVPADATPVVATDGGAPSLDDLAIACRALRPLLAGARDLDGRDLASPGTPDAPPAWDLAALEGRVREVRGALVLGRDALDRALPKSEGAPPRGDLRAAMLSVSGFDLGGPPVSVDDAGLVAEAQALLGRVEGRLTALDARVAEEAPGWAGLTDDARHRALDARIALLVGHAVPLAPALAAANAAELDASFDRARLGTSEAAAGWLAAAGRVDPGAGRLRAAVDLVEAARGGARFAFSLGQLPDHPGEGWAATERPTADGRGRLCLLACGHPTTFAEGAAGLVLGAFDETIPGGRQTAGIAVHFDAPSARPPQAVLLCCAESGTAFGFEPVRDTVREALSLARLRMVGPEILQGLGQFLPAAYLHADTNPGGLL
jgi:hypothetical protein